MIEPGLDADLVAYLRKAASDAGNIDDDIRSEAADRITDLRQSLANAGRALSEKDKEIRDKDKQLEVFRTALLQITWMQLPDATYGPRVLSTARSALEEKP